MKTDAQVRVSFLLSDIFSLFFVGALKSNIQSAWNDVRRDTFVGVRSDNMIHAIFGIDRPFLWILLQWILFKHANYLKFATLNVRNLHCQCITFNYTELCSRNVFHCHFQCDKHHFWSHRSKKKNQISISFVFNCHKHFIFFRVIFANCTYLNCVGKRLNVSIFFCSCITPLIFPLRKHWQLPPKIVRKIWIYQWKTKCWIHKLITN